MRVSEGLRHAIFAHALEVAPAEACGLVGGSEGEARSVYRARNVATERGRYELDARDQFRILERMRRAGEQLVAVYHSHPISEAWPSPVDVDLAEGTDVVHLIASLVGREPELRGFRIVDGQITALDVGEHIETLR